VGRFAIFVWPSAAKTAPAKTDRDAVIVYIHFYIHAAGDLKPTPEALPHSQARTSKIRD
jgi:hypothetical protein